MLETNIFVILFYSREIHVMQRDFEIFALVVYVDHRWTCDVTLFCVIRCFSVYSGAFAKHCWILVRLYKNVRSGDLRSQFGCWTTVTEEQTAGLNCDKPNCLY